MRAVYLLSVVATGGLLVHAQQAPFSIASHRTDSDDPILSAAVRTAIGDIFARSGSPAYSVALVRLGARTPLELATWGNATEDGDPMTPDTLVNIASMSKAFTAAAVALLIDDFAHGRNVTPLPDGVAELSWKTKVKDVLPKLRLYDLCASEHVTIQDMLSHLTGLPLHDLSYTTKDSPADLIARMHLLRPTFELREQWRYNNIPYMIMPELVARYSGLPFESFVASRLLAPLGMTRSTYNYTIALTAGLAHGFLPSGRRVPNTYADPTFAHLDAGAGGLMASAVDVAKWAAFLLGDGRPEGMPAARQALAECMRPHALRPHGPLPGVPAADTVTYGMGWFQMQYRGHRVVQHSGALGSVTTSIALLPDLGVGLVQLAPMGGAFQLNADVNALIFDAVLERAGAASADIPHDARVTLRVPAEVTPVLSARLPPDSALPLAAFAGTYRDAAYGNITLCAPSSISAYCQKVLSDFSSFPLPGDYDALYAAWSRLDVSHVRLVQLPLSSTRGHSHNTFGFRVTNLFPHGYGKNENAFEEDTFDALDRQPGNGRWEFDVDDEGRVKGAGWFGVAGPGIVSARERMEGSLEERCDIWMAKIE